jgi:hypothetical protein
MQGEEELLEPKKPYMLEEEGPLEPRTPYMPEEEGPLEQPVAWILVVY